MVSPALALMLKMLLLPLVPVLQNLPLLLFLLESVAPVQLKMLVPLATALLFLLARVSLKELPLKVPNLWCLLLPLLVLERPALM
mmetsp:Transcript_3009/g.7531  ORF Transcript_3009/g.7531 Transcript_3009/m.7531 type:complete len:85 (-) Transcript_3009:1357-1611(-)